MRSGRTRRVTAGNAFVHDRKAAAHLQNAQAVVQHALGVGDVVADWQRQAAQVRLQQQVGLGVRVVCRQGGGQGGSSGLLLGAEEWGDRQLGCKQCVKLHESTNVSALPACRPLAAPSPASRLLCVP